MTNYRSLVGQKIKKVSSNPSDALEGQVWYNTTEKKLKGVPQLQAWSSASPINTARYNMGSGNTPVTAGVIFGGTVSPYNHTEEYGGTNWTSSGNLGTGRYQLSGFGTQTTAVAAGGHDNSADVANVEEYNGSSWSEVTDIPAARRGAAGFGTQTAGVIAGGVPNLNTTLHYD